MIRVRWAPSNTGSDVHVGNVRTILFNYLFAKKNGGVTVFRVEDSDVARSKPEYADSIADTLDWLGLRADEGYKIGGDKGPYLQTQKLNRYKQVADELIEKGHAYRCYCMQEELTALRNQLPEKERHTFRYPGICRDRKDWPKDKDYVVRLKAPTEGSVEWDDLVFGKIVVPNKENFDWVLMRSNGIPLYNYGCTLDDFDQGITHVIRGRDHIGNTNCQKLLHQLLGSQHIEYAHLPMMLGADRSKLSKRHGSVSISEYRKAGYSPNGILNYLVRFGWGFKNQEIFSLEELVDKFSFDGCGKNDGCFDTKKFAVIQGEHLKSPTLTPDLEYATRTQPFLKSRGIEASIDQIKATIPIIRSRAKTFIEAANELDPILRKEIAIDPVACKKFLTPQSYPFLRDYWNQLNSVDVWNETSIKEKTNNYLTNNGIAMKDVGQIVRVAVVGRTNSPDLFAVMSALGKETTLARLAAGGDAAR